uniref:Uncharacterized protein LOC113799423 n=1 Tax=Dermatophagoides pteronyssinus TaxID=6956 RepID=A0A6P6YM07_DERPT|nr:uncharacterized protein LOC113799423 [Dermatophagoides pteronyssinus]
MASVNENFDDEIAVKSPSNASTNELPSLKDFSENVENIIRKINRRFSKNQSNCHTILYYGNDADRLRLIEFLFGQHIVSKCQWDVHLIRTNHLPNLFDHQQARELIQTTKQMDDLCFLKIYYLTSRESLFNHMMSVSASNQNRLLPKAFIIDDIMAYVADSSKDQQSSNDEPQQSVDIETDLGPKRKRPRTNCWNRLDEQFQNLIRIVNGSIETLEYCASRLQRTTYLIVKIDLKTFYANDSSLQQNQLFKLNRAHFKYKINVDQTPFEINSI